IVFGEVPNRVIGAVRFGLGPRTHLRKFGIVTVWLRLAVGHVFGKIWFFSIAAVVAIPVRRQAECRGLTIVAEARRNTAIIRHEPRSLSREVAGVTRIDDHHFVETTLWSHRRK